MCQCVVCQFSDTCVNLMCCVPVQYPVCQLVQCPVYSFNVQHVHSMSNMSFQCQVKSAQCSVCPVNVQYVRSMSNQNVRSMSNQYVRSMFNQYVRSLSIVSVQCSVCPFNVQHVRSMLRKIVQCAICPFNAQYVRLVFSVPFNVQCVTPVVSMSPCYPRSISTIILFFFHSVCSC